MRCLAISPVRTPGFELAVLSRGNPGELGRIWDAAGDGLVALEELRGTPVVLNL